MKKTSLPILVVEGDPSLAQLITVSLERVGLRVRIADSPTSARATMNTEHLALLIWDSTLSDEDALETRKEECFLRGKEFPRQPCIVLASTPEQQASLTERNEPWLRVMAKPFSPPELVMQVLTLLAEGGVYPHSLQHVCLPWRKVVVDLCCGSGLSTLLAAEQAQPDGLVIGVDRSFHTTREVKRRMEWLGYRNTCLVTAEVQALPFADGSVRKVFGTENFPYLNLPDPSQAWAEVKRIGPVEEGEPNSVE